jgi:hypothetical protein
VASIRPARAFYFGPFEVEPERGMPHQEEDAGGHAGVADRRETRPLDAMLSWKGSARWVRPEVEGFHEIKPLGEVETLAEIEALAEVEALVEIENPC